MLNTDPNLDTRRRGWKAPDSDAILPADAADARALVRHLRAQQAEDARSASSAYSVGSSYIIASHHDEKGNIR